MQKVTFVVWLTLNPFLYLYKNGFHWRILFLAPSATSKNEKWWKVLRVFRERSMIFRVMFQPFLRLSTTGRFIYLLKVHTIDRLSYFLPESLWYIEALYWTLVHEVFVYLLVTLSLHVGVHMANYSDVLMLEARLNENFYRSFRIYSIWKVPVDSFRNRQQTLIGEQLRLKNNSVRMVQVRQDICRSSQENTLR